MAFSKEKAFDRAERYAAKGQHDKAAREYQQIVDHDPKEIRAWLMLADCLVRCGDAPRAIERYLQVGGYYVQKKDHQKALAVYRQVLSLDASRIDVQLRVAALNRELGRVQDAVAMYERVAGLQLQSGKVADALQTYKVVADAEPTAVSRRLRLAELYSRERRTGEAVEAFRLAGQQLLTQGRKGDYVRVAERLLYHDGSDLPTVRQLAAVYIELGDPRRALMKLNALLHADAGDREGIELLAQTFIALGKPDKAVSAIGELARGLRESGTDEDLAESARVLRLGLSWSPGHPELTAALQQVEGEPEPEPEALPEPEPRADALEISLEDADVVELDDADVLMEDPEPYEAASEDPMLEPQAATFEPTAYEPAGDTAVPMQVELAESLDSSVIEVDDPGAPQPVVDPPSMTESVLSEVGGTGSLAIDTDSLTDFDKILFEARVYIKYRLFEHALDHVATALSQQPQHVGALSLQARALTELGRTTEAADSHARVARLVVDSDPKLAREHVAAAVQLTPGHVDALQVEEMLQREDAPADEISIAAPLNPEPLDEVAQTELLHVDSTDEPTANLLDIHHGSDGVEEEDFSIEVDVAEDSGEESVSSAEIEIEDRFGLDAPADEDNLVVDGGHTTGEFAAADGLYGNEVGAPETELLGADAAGTFEELAAEVSEHAERDLAGLDLLEPSVDTGVLTLNDHTEPRSELTPDGDDAPPEGEPDLLSLAIGKDQARALEPDVDLESGAADWPDISDDVAEVRFFVDQGLDEDADAAIEDLRRRHPGHPALAAFDPPAEPEAPVVPLEHGASTPLIAITDDADADADEDDDEDAYLSAIFSDPAPAKKAPKATGGARVASQNVDAQSSFDLGVAYREMGLVDQAVAQFEAAANDDAIRVRALVMLGTLRLQQGDSDAAVASLEEAVQRATTEDESAEANYELGVVYEKIGDTGKAIARLSAVSAGYRDRDERLGQLQR